MLIRNLLLVFSLIGSSTVLFAQTVLRGTVTDAATGEPVIATIVIQGTPRGTVTDADGNYQLQVTPGAQLSVTAVGYIPQTVSWNSESILGFLLTPRPIETLSHPGMVGTHFRTIYPTSAKTLIYSEHFNEGNFTDPLRLIQGKVAGLSISRPGSNPNGDYTLRLRGLSTFQANQSPLVVLDGVPGADLALIDPNDVEKITALKDASAAAIYGVRAANGVLLVTSRKGSQGKVRATYQATLSAEQATRLYNPLNASDFVRLGGTDFSPNDNTDTDWQAAILQTGLSNTQHLSLGGGGANSQFRAAFNYRNVEGVLRNTGLRQYNASVNLQQQRFNRRLHLEESLLMTSRTSDLGFSEAFRYAITTNPSAPITSTAPQYAVNGGYVEQQLFDYFNPVAIVEQNTNTGSRNHLLGRLRATYEVLSGLKTSVLLSREMANLGTDEFYSKQSAFRGRNRNGLAISNRNTFTTNLLDWNTQYERAIGQSEVHLSVGYLWQQTANSSQTFEAGNVLTNALGSNNLDAFRDFTTGRGDVDSNRGEDRTIAGWANARWAWKNLLHLNAGLRREGSSRLGTRQRWGFYPALSGGLNLVQWLPGEAISTLQMRLGYGVTGNRPAGNLLSQGIFQPNGTFYYNGNYISSFGLARVANPDLKPEKKSEWNLGLDLGLQDNHLSASLDLYSNRVTQLIQPTYVPTPPNVASVQYQNVGEISNRGLELSLSYQLSSTQDFRWGSDLVLNLNHTTLPDLASPDSIPNANIGAPGPCCGYYGLLYNGAPLGQLWGLVRTGINSNGQATYADVNGNGLTENIELEAFNRDQTRIGNGQPKLSLGFGNRLSWKRFDLQVFFRGVFGHDLVNEYRVLYENVTPSAATWNKVQTRFFDENNRSNLRFDDTHVERASFLRLDNATLGYNLPLPAGAWFSKIRLFVNGQNLFTLTRYTGNDPEPRFEDPGPNDNGSRLNANGNPLVLGIDRRGTYFLARTYTGGVRFEF